ncbi:MAG: hypothetical protein FJ241_07230 [Nitrospira sp.]|nr:hypothetical protein [Nitrospira sp.]
MDAIECIKTRMSIRKFKPDTVPLEILMKVIDTAKWSPSYKNSQPWEVVIVSGEKKEALSKFLVELLEQNTSPCLDLPEPLSWPPAIEARIAALMKKRSEITGKDLLSPDVRKKSKIANSSFMELHMAYSFFRIHRFHYGHCLTWDSLRRASCLQPMRTVLELSHRHFSPIMRSILRSF